MICITVGLLLILVTLLASIGLEGANLGSYINFVSLIICLLVPFFAVMSIWKLKSWVKAFGQALRQTGNKEEKAISVRIWTFYESMAYIAGLLALITNVILFLNRIEPQNWAFQLANCLTAPLYGLLLGMGSRVLRERITSTVSE
jgi:hypothetical protein